MATNNFLKCNSSDDGFVLVGALLILLLLVIIGISATTNTSLELQIAGNERVHKETFYQADGGSELAARLIEESLGTPGGFTALDGNNLLNDPAFPFNSVLVVDPTISENEGGRDETNISDAARDIAYYPGGYDPLNPNGPPHTNIIADGITSMVAGAGLQMLAGYEGKGKGIASGGGQIVYTIYSQHMGRSNSESVVAIQWRHFIGLELEGRY